MGMSLDSKLMFGVVLGNDDEDDLPEIFNFTEAELDNIERDDMSIGDILEAKIEGSGLIISRTNYYDFTTYFLTVEIDRANGDDRDPIVVTNLKPMPKYFPLFAEVCAKLGVEYVQPEWLVGCSYY